MTLLIFRDKQIVTSQIDKIDKIDWFDKKNEHCDYIVDYFVIQRTRFEMSCWKWFAKIVDKIIAARLTRKNEINKFVDFVDKTICKRYNFEQKKHMKNIDRKIDRQKILKIDRTNEKNDCFEKWHYFDVEIVVVDIEI